MSALVSLLFKEYRRRVLGLLLLHPEIQKNGDAFIKEVMKKDKLFVVG